MKTKVPRANPGQFLTFNLRSRPYGVAIGSVREINRMGDITPVPGKPKFVAGVMNLRGKVIPVVNLCLKLGLQLVEATRETCIIVVDTELGLIGMIVDSVSEVVSLGQNQIEPSPILGDVEGIDWVTGIGKVEDKVILLIDIEQVLSQVNINLNMPREIAKAS
jgi:purine-binding chemotaxis protein CheW